MKEWHKSHLLNWIIDLKGSKLTLVSSFYGAAVSTVFIVGGYVHSKEFKRVAGINNFATAKWGVLGGCSSQISIRVL